MAIITLPTNLRLGAGSGMGQQRHDLVTRSDATGAEQARVLGPPRWLLRLVQPPALGVADAAVWRALVLRLRGRVNHLAAHDPGLPAPRGTLRGSPTLSGSHALGATTLVLTGSSGTLLAGDMLGIGTGLGTSQLVMVTADCTQASVPIEPPLRTAFAGGTAVAWDRPTAYFRATTDAAQWSYGRGRRVVQGLSLDLLESWT